MVTHYTVDRVMYTKGVLPVVELSEATAGNDEWIRHIEQGVSVGMVFDTVLHLSQQTETFTIRNRQYVGNNSNIYNYLLGLSKESVNGLFF